MASSSVALHSWEQDGVFNKGDQNGFRRALLLPFDLGCKMGFSPKATRMASDGFFCCLSLLEARWGFQQRQPECLPTGSSVAFRSWEQDKAFDKGNQNGSRRTHQLPFAHGSKMRLSTKATRMAPDGLFCCLSLMEARWGSRQRQLE